MTILYLTGLSGVGKSSALGEMKTRGYETIDLDFGYITTVNGEPLIDEGKLQNVLDAHNGEHLIFAGTESNQGKFYDQFDAVILLTTDLETMFKRIKQRKNNPYGKSEADKIRIRENYEVVLPLLEKSSDYAIDTTNLTITEVCDQLESLLR